MVDEETRCRCFSRSFLPAAGRRCLSRSVSADMALEGWLVVTKKLLKCRHRFGVEGTKALQEIIPDLLIDGRFLSTTLDGVGASLLRGTRTLADVKTKSCDDKYPAERSGSACAVVTKRQQ